MKICVVGAGAIGGPLAAALASGGADVSLLARGPHLEAIRSAGLTIVQAGQEKTVRLRASHEAAVLGPQDAVVVAVKAQALPQVAAAIAPLLLTDTPVAFAVNGLPWWYFHAIEGERDGRRLEELDPGNLVWDTIGPQRAVGAIAYSAAAIVAPGRIEVASPRQRLILGAPSGVRTARITAIAEVLERGGYPVKISERIRDDIWSKLIGNMAGNLIATLTSSTLSQAFADEACRAAGLGVIREAEQIAAGLGCNPRIAADKMIAQFMTIDHRPSTLQDIEHGRPIEFDAMFGVPLRLARELKVETPTLDVLVALLKQRARSAVTLSG